MSVVTRRRLVLVAKITQNLANGSQFQEESLLTFNSLINSKENLNMHALFCSNICLSPRDTQETFPKIFLPSDFSSALAQFEFMNMLLGHQTFRTEYEKFIPEIEEMKTLIQSECNQHKFKPPEKLIFSAPYEQYSPYGNRNSRLSRVTSFPQKEIEGDPREEIDFKSLARRATVADLRRTGTIQDLITRDVTY